MSPPPYPPEELAVLCSVCQRINFAAILTPRSYNANTERVETIYRPEYQGAGGSPSAEWVEREDYHGWRKERRLSEGALGEKGKGVDGKRGSGERLEGDAEDEGEEDWRWLPRIKTAFYDDLSESTQTGDSIPAREGVFGEGGGWFGDDGVSVRERAEGIEAKGQELVDVSLGGPLFSEDGRRREARYGEEGVGRVGLRGGGEERAQRFKSSQESSRSYMAGRRGSSVSPSREELDDQVENADWSEDNEEDPDYNDVEGYDGDSVSTWSGHSHFTEIHKIDLDEQAKGKWDYRHGHLYYLGSVWDLRSRRYDCDLCWRLWRYMRKNPDVKNNYFTKSRCILKLMELKGRRNDGSNSEVQMLNLVFMYGYKSDDPRNHEWIVRMGFAMQGTHRDVCERRDYHSEKKMIPFGDSLFGESRWRENECDYGLFRDWLRVCETKHKHPTPELGGEMSIRLVDVQRKCLVEWDGPTSEVPSFMALSYVWGKLRQKVMLTTRELEKFKQPGFFNCELDETIRDSIELVSKMGQKYLWIDALCILQDSRQDKAVQVPQMHKIYGKSILTIVAAYGDGANSGLPGVGKSQRIGSRFRLELEDIQVTFRTNTKLYGEGRDISFKENYLEQSTYQNRGWTFQEGHLSTRVIVWTKEQVYWECPRCTWCEETHWESDSVDFVGWRAVKDPTPMDIWQDRMDRKAYDISPFYGPKEPEPLFNSYPELIKGYSQRALTYDGDILDAFTGVLNSVKQREHSDFMFGLRTKYFGNDLLFNSLIALPLRFVGQKLVKSGFPSWSWTSWKGAIQIANEARGDSYDAVKNLVPCDGVKCHVLKTTPGGEKILQLINECGGWRFQTDYVRTGEGIYDLSELQSVREKARNPNPSARKEEPKSERSIPEYPQNLNLSDIQSHPAFSYIVPDFHIMFRTFYCTVVLSTEFDEVTMMMSKVVIGGTHKLRGGGIWENRDAVQRQLYVCKKKEKNAKKAKPGSSLRSLFRKASHKEQSHNHTLDDTSTCPCCGKENPVPIPDSLEQGSYIGRLPPISTSWNPQAYLEAIPDGIYRLLWMNNNQLPMFGHLLCKPVSEKASRNGEWNGEILQRVCGVSGPTKILERGEQERWGVEWGTVVLS